MAKLAERLPAYGGAAAAGLRRLKDLLDPGPPPGTAPPPVGRIPDSTVDPGPAVRGGGAAQPLPKHSYTEIPEILLPGPQIPGADVVPSTPAALGLSEMGHLFSFATTG